MKSPRAWDAPTVSGVRYDVCSRTLADLPDPNCEVIHEDAFAFVRNLQQLLGKDICLLDGCALGASCWL